jgi:hypothetical protein
MNIVKNMEAFFVAALAVAAFSAYATADVKPVAAKPVEQISSSDGRIATVVVSTKRLSAEEKARLGS